MNKKILASIFVIGILALAMGWGTYSYFSSTRYSTGNVFTAGTLNVQLSNDQITWADEVTATWESPSNWAPGQWVNATLSATNVGSIGAFWYYFGISGLYDPNGLASQIFVMEFLVNITERDWGAWADGTYNHVGWMATTWGPWSTEAPLTLAEFAQWWDTATPYGFMAYGPDILGPDSDNEVKVTMKLLFNPDAGNVYQGAYCAFNVKVGAFQEGYPVFFVYIGGGSEDYGYGNA